MKSKILMLVVALMLVLSTAAYADVLNQPVQDDITGALTISGHIEGYGYADAFTLAVFKNGKSFADIVDYTPAEMLAVMTHFGTYMTDAEGNYEVNLSTKGLDAGDYTVVVNTKDGLSFSKAIFVASRDSKVKFIGDIAKLVEDGCTAEELNEKLALSNATTVNAKVFEILEDSIIFTVDADAFAQIVFYNIEETENFEETEPEDFVTFLENCAKIQQVNEGEINPADDADFFGLNEAYVETYTENLDDDIKADFAVKFKDGGYKAASEIAESFNEFVVVAVLENAEAWKDYKNLIESHGEDLGVDMKAYNKLTSSKKNKISSYMANSYDNPDDFADDVNDAIDDINSSKGGSSSGSAGGRPSGGITGASTKDYPIDMTPQPEPEKEPEKKPIEFTDLESSLWAKEAIDALSKEGIVNGIGEGLFAPEASVTREQFVKMIVSALKITAENAENKFEDVAVDSWYADAVNIAADNGIISGIGEGNFGVGINITRQDAAVILFNASKLAMQDAELSFADAAEISGYALEAVKQLTKIGVINGTGDGNFAPKATCTRAQAAVMIYRLLGEISK